MTTLAALACGGEGASSGADGSADGSACDDAHMDRQGVCLPRLAECAGGEAPLPGGGCERVGPAPECWEGFVPDGEGGCDPVLPSEDCPEGAMPVIGEPACVSLRDCGAAPWGNVAIESGAIFVDASYAGADADGTESRPWPRIQDAIDVAPSGSQIVVAAGEYLESLFVDARVRIEGRCPALTVVRGASAGAPAVLVEWEGVELRGLGITGPAWGVVVNGRDGAIVEECAVHDCGFIGVLAQNGAEVTVRRSVVARSELAGIQTLGSTATIDEVVVRDTAPQGPESGQGLSILDDLDPAVSSTVTVRRSLAAGNAGADVVVYGSSATIEESAVGDGLAGIAGVLGRGFQVSDGAETGLAAGLVLRRSVVAGAGGFGVLVAGAAVDAEDLIVRATRPTAVEPWGIGVAVVVSPVTGSAASGSLRSALVSASEGWGLYGGGASLAVESVVVRDTAPGGDEGMGSGVDLRSDPDGAVVGDFAVRAVAIERSAGLGMSVIGTVASIEGCATRDTGGDAAGAYGNAVQVRYYPLAGLSSDVALRASVVSGGGGSGLSIEGSVVRVEDLLVSGMDGWPSDASFGDGVDVEAESDRPAPEVQLSGLVLDDNRRAGVLFNGAGGVLARSWIHENRFAVALERGADPAIGDDVIYEDNERDEVVVGQGLDPPPTAEAGSPQ